MSKKKAPGKKSRRATEIRSSETRRRLAVRKTWQPNGRIERTLQRKWLTFHTPAQFIREAGYLVPERNVRGISLFSMGELFNLALQFGCDEHGESTSISIKL